MSYMNKTCMNKLNKDEIMKRVCDFLNVNQSNYQGEDLIENIKEVCVARLCKTIGLTGKYNYKSKFFEFFSCVMGEAVCEKLSAKVYKKDDL